ncbi:unnamed protein product [Rodentolepis nana]|uniref:Uncharacterized protein n=1 Tax=Rodentolepis nana TaxID=102285 RepID=A0A0R3TW79_RODNA|nr:unnamed protein product [Rodentolepis nana]
MASEASSKSNGQVTKNRKEGKNGDKTEDDTGKDPNKPGGSDTDNDEDNPKPPIDDNGGAKPETTTSSSTTNAPYFVLSALSFLFSLPLKI